MEHLLTFTVGLLVVVLLVGVIYGFNKFTEFMLSRYRAKRKCPPHWDKHEWDEHMKWECRWFWLERFGGVAAIVLILGLVYTIGVMVLRLLK